MERTRKQVDEQSGFTKSALPRLIDTRFRKPEAITAAMLAAAHAVIAEMAGGATWQEEPDLKIPSGLGADAARKALIWDRIASYSHDGSWD